MAKSESETAMRQAPSTVSLVPCVVMKIGRNGVTRFCGAAVTAAGDGAGDFEGEWHPTSTVKARMIGIVKRMSRRERGWLSMRKLRLDSADLQVACRPNLSATIRNSQISSRKVAFASIFPASKRTQNKA